MRGLGGRVAVVTGAGSGIGRATARRLAEEGAVVAAVDVVADRAETVAEDIAADGGRSLALGCDANDRDQVAAAWARVTRELGGLDILINSVSWAPRRSFQDVTFDDWHGTIDGCLNSYFVATKLALPALIASRRGKIVNVCSISAHIGYGVPAYTAAKGAILAWTRQLAGELAPHKVNVNSISPGVVASGRNEEILADPEIRGRAIELTPWGRLGRPEDIAAPIAFLASEDADFVTGADLVVDGALSSTVAWGAVREQLGT